MKILWQILLCSLPPGPWRTVSGSMECPGACRQSMGVTVRVLHSISHLLLDSVARLGDPGTDLDSSRYDLIIDVSADRWWLLQHWNLQINSIIRFLLSAAIIILSHRLLLSNAALSPCNGTSEISSFSLLQEIRTFPGFKSRFLKS